MDDIVQQIIGAASMAKPWEWEPKHPQYVEGTLYLTQAQWGAMCEAFPDYDRSKWSCRPALAWGIPVRIVKPNTVVDLPSGRVLTYSAALESIYMFDRKIADDAGLCSGLSKVAEVEPAEPVGNQPQEQQ